MEYERSRICEDLLANETGQILAAGAGIMQVMFGDHVINQLHRITERLVAPFALMLRLRLCSSGVEEHVFVQIRLLAVRFLADGASILLLAGFVRMDFHVNRQTGGLRERFRTILAVKRPLTCVDAHMRIEAVKMFEMLCICK